MKKREHKHKCSKCLRILKCDEKTCLAYPNQKFTCKEWDGKECRGVELR